MKNQLLILWTILLTVNFSFAQPQWKFHIAFEDATGAKDTIWCIWDTAATDGQLNSVDTAFGEAGVTFDYNLFNVWIYNNVPFPYTDSTKTSAIPFNGAFSLEIRAFNYQYPITVSWDSSLFHAPGLPLPVGYVNRAVMDNDYFFLVNNDPPLQRFNMLLDNSVIAPSFWWGSQSQFPLIIGIMRDETIGINEMDMGKKTLTVYPNPVRDELNFTHNENTVLFHIIVQDIAGRIVIHLKQSNSTIPDKLDVSILETGIYTITFSGHNGFQHTSKFAIIK